jgi:hypothetical protein
VEQQKQTSNALIHYVKSDTRGCFVSKHNNAKLRALKRKIIEEIYTAINSKTMLWIKYSGGKTPGKVRPVQPLDWIRSGKEKRNKYSRFYANCCCPDCTSTGEANMKKEYKLIKVVDARTTMFE